VDIHFKSQEFWIVVQLGLYQKDPGAMKTPSVAFGACLLIRENIFKDDYGLIIQSY